MSNSGNPSFGGYRISRIVRGTMLLLLLFVLLPYIVMPLYLVIRPVSTSMIWRWMTGVPVTRIFVPIEGMTPILPRTVIVAEDAKFCSHGGIDWDGIRQVLQNSDDADDMRGASTISQQTVKNLFLWQGRSYLRKALEFPLTLWAEMVLPKRRILEIYLNIAEWGPDGEFGIEAGARRAFNKSARDLTAREAALLTATLPNPIIRNARRPGPALRRLAAIHQSRAASGFLLDSCIRKRHSP